MVKLDELAQVVQYRGARSEGESKDNGGRI